MPEAASCSRGRPDLTTSTAARPTSCQPAKRRASARRRSPASVGRTTTCRGASAERRAEATHSAASS
eukprot:2062427-Prymnesium_polylepis.1